MWLLNGKYIGNCNTWFVSVKRWNWLKFPLISISSSDIIIWTDFDRSKCLQWLINSLRLTLLFKRSVFNWMRKISGHQLMVDMIIFSYISYSLFKVTGNLQYPLLFLMLHINSRFLTVVYKVEWIEDVILKYTHQVGVCSAFRLVQIT